MGLSAKYGSGFYKRLSADLKELLPTVKSLSETNLRYMAWFYELYSVNPQQAVVDLGATDKQLPSCSDYISESIFSIPWGIMW